MIRKIIGVAVCFAAIITQAGGQGLGIELNGGLQGTQYQLQNGQNKLLPGGSFGLIYTFHLSSQWGLLTGLTGGVYRMQASLPDGTVFTTYQVDDAGSAFKYSMNTEGYKETQQFFAASIPLLLQYHTAGAGTQWYFNGGGKVLLPSTASINISARQLSLSGYYPDFNLNVSNLPQHGFGTLNDWKASTSSQLKPAAALSAATGISFRLSPGVRLYTGVYVEYGLTDVKGKNDSLPLVTYSPTGVSGIQTNSVLNVPNAGQMKLRSFGLQVRFNFGSARTKPAVKAKTNKGSQQPADSAISYDEVKVIQQSVVFGLWGETAVPEVQYRHLDQVVKIMMQYPDIRISIVGHICNNGKETENAKVGTARAKAVARYLRNKGIDRGRIDISAVGKSDPERSDNPAANYRSRRVVITIED